MGISHKFNRFTLVLAKTTILLLIGNLGEAKVIRIKEGVTSGSSKKSAQAGTSRFSAHQLLVSGNPPLEGETHEPDSAHSTTAPDHTTEVTVCANALPFYWNGNLYPEAGEFAIQRSTKGEATENLVLKLSVSQPATWYPDADGDGFGNGNRPMFFCHVPVGYVQNNTDCNDSDSTIQDLQEYFVDADGDGFGSDVAVSFCSSKAPRGFSAFHTDCDDRNASIHPTSTKPCRGINNELNALSFSVYPNTGTGRYTVSVSQPMEHMVLALYDLQGQQIWEKPAHNDETTQSMNIESHPTGIYLLKCKAEGFSQNLRVVKL